MRWDVEGRERRVGTGGGSWVVGADGWKATRDLLGRSLGLRVEICNEMTW